MTSGTIVESVASLAKTPKGLRGLGVFVDQGRVGDVDMGAEELDDERDDRRVGGQLGEGRVLD